MSWDSWALVEGIHLVGASASAHDCAELGAENAAPANRAAAAVTEPIRVFRAAS